MLKIDSSPVGTELATIEVEVTWRRTTNYAAALADLNPRYFDDTRKGGIIAPPLFAIALTWPVMEDLPNRLGKLISPEIISTMVHASEHLVFHRAIKPGDKLFIRSRVAAILPTRAGALLVLRLEAEDKQGAPVFTEINGAMLRGVKCVDPGQGRENLLPAPAWEEAGDPVWQVEVPVARELPYVYDGCSDIVFPIHTSPAFAKMVGLPDIILQGSASLALAAREIVAQEADHDPERLAEIACRFSGMVIPGEAIKVELMTKKAAGTEMELGFHVRNAHAQTALTQGYARLTANRG